MHKDSHFIIIRRIDYKMLLEEFIISSVAALLIIRTYLRLADYPMIGSGQYHISHMLWGGLLMGIAILQFLIILNPQAKHIGAILGGLGFGVFIDELGKFITRDNNYFFQPAFAYIYLVFMSLYILLHILGRNKEFSEKEYLSNSIELMKDAVIDDLDIQEKQRALEYLANVQTQSQVKHALQIFYSDINSIEVSDPHIINKMHSLLAQYYHQLVRTMWFRQTIIIFFLGQALISLVVAVLYFFEKNPSILPALLLPTLFTSKSFNTIHLYASICSIALVFAGVFQIFHSRLVALVYFKRSILVSILIGEVFAFYASPQKAITMLAFHLLILACLNTMIETEKMIRPVHA